MADEKQIDQAWREIDSDIERERRPDNNRLDFLERELANVYFDRQRQFTVELPRYCEGKLENKVIRCGKTPV
jgi:hypothetical protein